MMTKIFIYGWDLGKLDLGKVELWEGWTLGRLDLGKVGLKLGLELGL